MSEIRVLKGNPTDAEIAAVVTVLAGLGGASAKSGPSERLSLIHISEPTRPY